MSARKDSEESHESAETLRQKEGALREMERRTSEMGVALESLQGLRDLT